MARPRGRQPFYREGRGWYVWHHGQQVKLGKNKDAAFKEWHRLEAAPPPVASELVAGVVEAYLDWCEKNRSERTFEWSKKHLQSFCKSLPKPKEFPVTDLKAHHVVAWADGHETWGPSQKRGAIGAVQRAFNWAEELQHIDRNPIRRIPGKPAQGRREEYLTAEQFEQVVSHYDEGDPFRDLLMFTWETGCRPQEVKAIEARHYAHARKRIEFPPSEAKGKKRWRSIYLTDKAEAIIKRLAAKHKTGPLFRNVAGKPWTAWATNCRLERLKEKLGFKVSVYALRHSYCQRMLEAGLDTTTVAALMGHANSVMVSQVYSHMGKATDFLAEQLKKAAG